MLSPKVNSPILPTGVIDAKFPANPVATTLHSSPSTKLPSVKY